MFSANYKAAFLCHLTNLSQRWWGDFLGRGWTFVDGAGPEMLDDARLKAEIPASIEASLHSKVPELLARALDRMADLSLESAGFQMPVGTFDHRATIPVLMTNRRSPTGIFDGGVLVILWRHA